MVILDTDHLSLLERPGSGQGERLRQRVLSVGIHEFTTTIITYEEQSRGWLSFAAQARTIGEQVEAYKRLKTHLNNYRALVVLEFDQEAAWQFERLQKLRLRISTMDLKISAITLVHNATLLSRNLQHFQQVPGLKVEDWTT
jgi:tRNA(fMet)-specific endonuclease VapC